jgi:bacteriocin-like protein
MKNVLSSDELAQISGGKFWDGFCIAVGAANLAAPFLALTGVGTVVLVLADIGCLAYGASLL